MAECKGCVKNAACVERRYFGGNQKNCKDFQKKTHYTLEEIAQKICESYEECTEGVCPGFDYCNRRLKKNGVLEWLKEIVEK
jgi:hypothetical protein